MQRFDDDDDDELSFQILQDPSSNSTDLYPISTAGGFAPSSGLAAIEFLSHSYL